MKAVVFDTETTGLPLFHDPSGDPRQPHIVQLAALLVDLDSRETIASIDLIIKPQGWDIPNDAAAVHGITTERALDVGVHESLAVEMLLDMARGRARIAHNETFDRRIVRIACKRYFNEDSAEEWATGEAYCTAKMATPIMKLPPTNKMRAAGRFHHKTPNLGEAFQFFTGHKLVGAHGALADAQACRDIFFAIRDREAAMT